MLRKLVILVSLFALLAGSAEAATPTRNDAFPLKVGSAGPRVCDLQYIMQAKRPSAYRDPYFRVRKNKPSCYFGKITAQQLMTLKYKLGQPKPYTSTYPSSLRSIILGQKQRPAKWVALAVSRRTSGSVNLKAYPVPDRRTLIGFPFSGTHRLGNYQSDNAVDIPCSPGSRIVAPISGRLFGGYGQLGIGGSRFMGQRINMVGLYKKRTVQFYLAHMKTIVVPRFATVIAGQKVGTCGPANGIYHLHIGATYSFPIRAFIEGRY